MVLLDPSKAVTLEFWLEGISPLVFPLFFRKGRWVIFPLGIWFALLENGCEKALHNATESKK
jgi:hypothetical protein